MSSRSKKHKLAARNEREGRRIAKIFLISTLALMALLFLIFQASS